MENTQQKSVKKWVLLLVVPVVALLLVSVAQLVARFVLASSASGTETGLETQGSGETIKVVINIFSLVVGVVSVIALLLTPLWLVMLVRDLKGYERSKTVAIVLAVFFGFWSWIYTWDKDSQKLWICLAIAVVTFGYGLIVGWIWAIIDNASKPDEFYRNYNQTLPPSPPAHAI